MAAWTQADLMALKANNPIVDVARELGLEVSRLRFRCPRPERHTHGDRTPSVSLSPERGTFKCWVCPEVKGDVIELVRVIQGVGFSEAVEFLRARAGKSLAWGKEISKSGHGAHAAHPSQAELFPASDPVSPVSPVSKTAPEFSAIPVQQEPATSRGDNRENNQECLAAFLALCRPVHGKPAAWLRKRRIFQKTWIAQQLQVVDDYGKISEQLSGKFSLSRLQASGLFNAEGHLRFYRHVLILPYLDAQGVAVYLQARAIEAEVKPKELSLRGSIPCPYNVKLLDGEPGPVYLCEGVVDTLTLLEAGFKAVGVPGASNFKPEWVPLFGRKSVYIAFDADVAGEAGAVKAMSLLTEGGIEAHRLVIPPGKDINSWLSPG